MISPKEPLMLKFLLLALFTSKAAGQSTQLTFDNITSFTNLTWYPCYTEYFCSRLDVPLDYSNPEGPRSSIPLLKTSAWTNTTYKGMVLLNPGGPGGSGLNFLVLSGNYISNVVGRNYDLVSWDPRGVGYALPSSDCATASNSTTSRRLRRRHPHMAESLLKHREEKVPRIKLAELNETYVESIYNEARPIGLECQQTIGGPDGIGMHMSTADVARDMISILDAYANSDDGKRVPEPESLNYWGFSYGTFIGETFASMFPDRVGRVALDGVLDPEDWRSGRGQKMVTFADDVWGTFYLYCNAVGIKLCPIYTGTTPTDIYNRVEKSFFQLNASYAYNQNWANATMLDQGLQFVKSVLALVVYEPVSYFPIMPQFVLDMETYLQNLTEANLGNWQITFANSLYLIGTDNGTIFPTVIDLPNFNFPGQQDIVTAGIWDSDDGGSSYNLTLEELKPWIEEIEEQSVVSAMNWINVRVWKTAWPMVTSDRYTGPFGGGTKNPMLFVSNTLDPVTPITNSQTWSPAYTGSQILTTDGTGHCSLASLNSCANAKIHAYFQDGTLPGSNNFCPLEAGPFGIVLPGGLEKRSEYRKIRNRMGSMLKM